jgi:murein DD-endopeptidase MepM/ murein hydrolase activator NlpD
VNPGRRFLAAIALVLVVGVIGVPARAWAIPALPAPAVWPVDPPVEVIRGFERPAAVWGAGHRGVDLRIPPGGVVRAAAAGTVSFAAVLAGRGVVVIDHGSVRTTYEPVDAGVVVGEAVVAGQEIGRLGSGGHCSGWCLHWGLRQAREYLNPLSLLGGDKGRVRLVAAAQRVQVQAAAQRRAEQQAAIVAAAGIAGTGHGGLGDTSVPAGHHGFLMPVPGPITSGFGMRLHPVLNIWKLHDGTDLGAACGTAIRAPYAGRVGAAYFNPGYGNRLMIDHGVVDGRHVVTGFNHATSFLVGDGDRVAGGQVIGFVGSTGFSTGCHLHLMVWLDGRVVDPMTWL